MRANRSSITAENNAAIRALEAMRPAAERICSDPYAKFFIAEELLQAPDLQGRLTLLTSGWERLFPGVCNAILARTRFIDECLRDALQGGLEQLVILGAGYDSRALRFEPLLKGIKVFELDHPSTLAQKLRRFSANMPIRPAHVTFIPINFDEDQLQPKLLENSYDRSLKTLFIWEGVTCYLAGAAVGATLEFIARNTPAGSSVVFDYFSSDVAAGTSPLREARALVQALEHLGERIKFGIRPAQLKAFLKERGFDLMQNMTAQSCQMAFFKSLNRHRAVSAMFVFAQAVVKTRPTPS